MLAYLKKHQESHKIHRESSKRTSAHSSDEVVDLTDNNLTSPDQHFSTNRKRSRQNIQWDSTIKQIQQYNPESTPKQLFASSTTLSNTKPIYGQPKQFIAPPSPFSGQTSPFLEHTMPFLGQINTQYPTTGSHPTSNITNTQHPYIHTAPFSNHLQMLTPTNNMPQAYIPQTLSPIKNKQQKGFTKENTEEEEEASHEKIKTPEHYLQ